jgi:hypothetical protein
MHNKETRLMLMGADKGNSSGATEAKSTEPAKGGDVDGGEAPKAEASPETLNPAVATPEVPLPDNVEVAAPQAPQAPLTYAVATVGETTVSAAVIHEPIIVEAEHEAKACIAYLEGLASHASVEVRVAAKAALAFVRFLITKL